MGYQKIEKKLFEVGFDNFHQGGLPNKFHPLNIIAESKATNKQYWICVDGGYLCKEEFHIDSRELGNIKAPSTRIKCKNQSEIVEQLSIIQLEIQSRKELTA